jgi:GTP-binding protein Era
MGIQDQLKSQVLARWELAADEVGAALRQTLAIAFLGSASSGKDSAIRALFGLDFGQIDPIPGSTEHVRVAAVDADRQVLVINAPGFGDVRASVDREARRALDQLDLAIYVLNCDGGATIDEKRDLDAIRALNRPTLVCFNKIDLIRPNQREAFVRQTRVQLGVPAEMCVETAFDPLPVLSEHPIGVDAVVRWIDEHLEKNGKNLLFAKSLRNRAVACEAIIRAAARRAAMAGAIPVPGADITAVTVIQVKLISDIAAVHDKRIDGDLALFIVGESLAGGSKGFIRWSVNALKAAGWIPGGQVAQAAIAGLGGAIAAATTYGVGKAALRFMQSERALTGDELREVFDAEAFTWRTRDPQLEQAQKLLPGPETE